MLRYSLMVASGLVAIVLGLVIFFVLEAVTRKKILDAIVIDSADHRNYDDWTRNYDPGDKPLYYKFYVFNLTNPDAVVAGTERPAFAELGPYIYRRYEQKQSIVFYDDGNEVRYYQHVWYGFEAELSAPRSDTELVFNVNPYYVAAVNMAGSEAALNSFLAGGSTDPTVIQAKRRLLNANVGTPYGLFFRQLSIRQSIFGPDKLVAAAGTSAPPFFSNDTISKQFTVLTGKRSASQAGMNFFTQYEGVEVCRQYRVNFTVYGRTNSMEPFQGATPDTIQLWFPLTQFYITMTFNGVEEVQGIETARYVLDVGAVTQVDPLVYRTIQGFNALSPFYQGAPLYLSLPHFGGAEQQYFDAVTGIQYDAAKYATYLDLEPITGSALIGTAKTQLNVFLNFTGSPYADVPRVDNRSLVMMAPILWGDQTGQIDKAGAQKLKQSVVNKVVARRAVLGSLVGLGVVCVLIGAALMVQKGGNDAGAAEPAGTSVAKDASPESDAPNAEDNDLQPFVPPPPPPQDELEMENIGPRG